MLRVLLLTISVLLGACSSLPPAGTALSVHPYQDALTMNGRLSVRYLQAGKEQSVQGKFSWTQTRDNISIVLFSPLGQTMAKIEIAPDFASLQRAGEAVQRASDVSELTTRLLGWPLPVSSLRDWLQGYVRDTNGTRLAARSDALQNLGNDGWQARYVSWQGDAAASFPKRIDLQRGSAGSSEIGLRIVIDSWQPQ